MIKNMMGKMFPSFFATGEGTAAKADPRLTAPKNQALPDSLVVASKPNELPDNYTVISGRAFAKGKDKRAIAVELQAELADKICILKLSATECRTIVSTDFYHDPERMTAFAKIRTELELKGYKKTPFMWAAPDLVANLVRSKQGAASETEQDGHQEFSKKINESANKEQFIKFVATGVRLGASDLHVEVKRHVAYVRYTIDSKLYPSPDTKDGELMRDIAYNAIAHAFLFDLDDGSNSSSHYDEIQQHSCTITLKIEGKSYRLRMQSNPTAQGMDLIARIAPHEEYANFGKLEDSGYAPDQLEMLRSEIPTRNGIIIFAGIPNSGKTTSLVKCLVEIPNRTQKKFVGIEDPTEYELPFQSSGTIQAGIEDEEKRSKSYVQTVASWLRGNPHVMNNGEIRDAASGDAAVSAAQLGLCVFATTHCGSAMGVMPRLATKPINIEMDTLTLPQLIKLMVYQALIPKLCDDCKIPFAHAPEQRKARMRRVGTRFGVNVESTFFCAHDPECATCHGRGHKGQTLAAEMIKPTDDFLDAMRRGDVFKAKRIWLSESDGQWDSDNMRGKPAFAHAFKKMLDGAVDIDEVQPFGNPDSYDVNTIRPNETGNEFRGREIYTVTSQGRAA